MRVRYITGAVASAIDADLMGRGGYALEQLMELAGLSCAQAVLRCYPPSRSDSSEGRGVLVACGPGNNGGDGLVAARHLYHFGYEPTVWYPKQGKHPHFQALKTQLEGLNVPFIATEDFADALDANDVLLDAVFGFSFSGPAREPFAATLETLKYESRIEFEARKKMLPIVSIDIPSGWHVEQGNVDGACFTPSVLVSLTAPKLGAKGFQGRHFLGGRFVPDDIEEQYDLQLPAFEGDSQVVEITGAQPLQEQE